MVFDNDHSFFKRIQNGDECAYHELIERSAKPLYNIAYGILKNEDDSNDAVMATYEALFQNRKLLKYPKGIESWLHVTVTRKACDIKRANKHLVFMNNDEIADVKAESAAADDLHDDDIITEKIAVNDCLRKMPTIQRDILLLKFCGFPNRAITDITGLSAAKIKLAHLKAKIAFKEYFEAKDNNVDSDR